MNIGGTLRIHKPFPSHRGGPCGRQFPPKWGSLASAGKETSTQYMKGQPELLTCTANWGHDAPETSSLYLE